MLLFSEIPKNEIYRWTADKGAGVYLKPAGFTGTGNRKGELGSNGLLLLPDGRLALCQHGDRRVAVMDAPLDKPQSKFITLAGRYQGKRLNSPNDLALSATGDIYFTDPPYGLEGQANDPQKELAFQGVYRVEGDSCRLLIDSISRPNGIALMPGEKQLLVANSDPDNPVWYIYDISDDGSLINGKIFAQAPKGRSEWKGLPDGLKIDRDGNVFATGPGGVYIFNKTGAQLGMIHFPEACSNVALADGGHTLWITADSYLLRVKMKTN